MTIGQPLPTYTTVILDPENPFHALPHGEVGEIGIAGIGLATRLPQPRRPDRQGVHPGLPRHRRQPLRADLPHRRPGPGQRRGRDRVPRPDRPAGEDPRLPDRADRDRVGAAAGARGSPRWRSTPSSRSRARRSWSATTACAAGAGTAGPGHDHRAPARAVAALHGPGLPRAARRDPDDPAGQDRPSGPAGTELPPRRRPGRRARRRGQQHGEDPGRRAGPHARPGLGLGDQPLLRRPRR